MTNYSQISQRADNLIKRKGVACTVVSIENVKNDEDDSVISQSKINYYTKLVLLPQDYLGRKESFSAGTEQPTSLIKAIMSAIIKNEAGQVIDYKLSKKDSVIAAGVTYRISTIDSIKPNGVPLLYELDLYG